MLMKLLVNTLAFWVVANLVPGFRIADLGTLLAVVVVWGLLSMILKPILLLLTLPVNVMTLGLFTFVINAFLIMIMSSWVRGFEVDGFGVALISAVLLALVNMVLGKIK